MPRKDSLFLFARPKAVERLGLVKQLEFFSFISRSQPVAWLIISRKQKKQ